MACFSTASKKGEQTPGDCASAVLILKEVGHAEVCMTALISAGCMSKGKESGDLEFGSTKQMSDSDINS